MDTNFIPFDKVKQLFPDEWILLGNPEMKNTKVEGGVVLFHSKDKKEVCYLGRDKTSDFAKVTIVFTGNFKKQGSIGILKRL